MGAQWGVGGVHYYSGWAVFIAVPFKGLRAGGFAWLGFVMPVFFVCACLLGALGVGRGARVDWPLVGPWPVGPISRWWELLQYKFTWRKSIYQ